MKRSSVLLKTCCYLKAIFVMILINGCIVDEEGKICRPAPSNCSQSEPNGDVKIKLNIGESLKSVKVELFSGAVEDGDRFSEFLATSNEITKGAPNGRISGRAFYTTIMNRETTTVIVVNGCRLNAEEKDYCDDVKCYEPGSAKLDLRLAVSK